MTEQQSTPGHGQGGGQLPPITDPYTTVPGDTLPSIAERAGHPGEWVAIAEYNIASVTEDMSDEAKLMAVVEKSQRPDQTIRIPAGWVGAETKPASEATEAADAAEQLESHARTRARARDE